MEPRYQPKEMAERRGEENRDKAVTEARKERFPKMRGLVTMSSV